MSEELRNEHDDWGVVSLSTSNWSELKGTHTQKSKHPWRMLRNQLKRKNYSSYPAFPIWPIPKNNQIDKERRKFSLCWSISQRNDRMRKIIIIFAICNEWLDLGIEYQWLLASWKDRQVAITKCKAMWGILAKTSSLNQVKLLDLICRRYRRQRDRSIPWQYLLQKKQITRSWQMAHIFQQLNCNGGKKKRWKGILKMKRLKKPISYLKHLYLV